MTELLKTWEKLTLRKRILLGVSVIGSMVAVLLIGRIAMTPGMSLLYGGLDQKNAGEVVAALEQMGVQTDIRGDSIYVPSTERDRVRLALAQQGLPGQGQAGYELLDNLSGFGTTSEMFQAAYWRAKEGELARTINSVPNVRKARVHIGANARRPFQRGESKATAAVTVHTAGGGLSQKTAVSIRYLVALAVASLDPSDVAVIDAEHGVILRPGADRSIVVGAQEADRRAQVLRLELEELIATRVGENNVRVSVTIETTKKTQTISERIVDPESQVPLNAESEEITDNSKGAGGAVTVASNLPEGDAAVGGGSENNRSETRETINYQYSETRRDQRIEAGAVKRLGVAVLVNQVPVTAADGTVSFEQRAPEELAAIEELIKSAIAYDAERGDVVTVESMLFAPVPLEGALVEDGVVSTLLREQGATILQILALGLVALLLGLFVLRPILAPPSQEEEQAALETQQPALPTITPEQAAAIAAQLESGADINDIADIAAENGVQLTVENAKALGLPDIATITTPEAAQADALQASKAYSAVSAAIESEEEGDSLRDRFEDAVQNRKADVVALMRSWLSNNADGEANVGRPA